LLFDVDERDKDSLYPPGILIDPEMVIANVELIQLAIAERDWKKISDLTPKWKPNFHLQSGRNLIFPHSGKLSAVKIQTPVLPLLHCLANSNFDVCSSLSALKRFLASTLQQDTSVHIQSKHYLQDLTQLSKFVHKFLNFLAGLSLPPAPSKLILD
jgi:hypothetical protein